MTYPFSRPIWIHLCVVIWVLFFYFSDHLYSYIHLSVSVNLSLVTRFRGRLGSYERPHFAVQLFLNCHNPQMWQGPFLRTAEIKISCSRFPFDLSHSKHWLNFSLPFSPWERKEAVIWGRVSPHFMTITFEKWSGLKVCLVQTSVSFCLPSPTQKRLEM